MTNDSAPSSIQVKDGALARRGSAAVVQRRGASNSSEAVTHAVARLSVVSLYLLLSHPKPSLLGNQKREMPFTRKAGGLTLMVSARTFSAGRCRLSLEIRYSRLTPRSKPRRPVDARCAIQ